MAIGKRPEGRQEELFVATSEIRRLSHPFYRVLERLLQAGGFNAFAEETCREFYAPRRGRPSLPPGVYFRMLLVGYLEGVSSERGIAWRCADSISLLRTAFQRPRPGTTKIQSEAISATGC